MKTRIGKCASSKDSLLKLCKKTVFLLIPLVFFIGRKCGVVLNNSLFYTITCTGTTNSTYDLTLYSIFNTFIVYRNNENYVISKVLS